MPMSRKHAKKVEKRLYKRNFRDLAQYHVANQKLRPHSFFRSGKLYKLKEKEIAKLESYHISTILDFRTEAEQNQKMDTPLNGAKVISIPLINAEMLGITHENNQSLKYKKPPHMPTLYRQLVSNEQTLANIKKGFDIVFDPDREGAILWHCTEGKDRAGIFTALFLLSLGYDKGTVIEDYEKTNAVSEPKGKKYKLAIRCLMFNNKLAKAVHLAMCAKKEYLEAALDCIEEQFGSLDNFFRDYLKLTDERIASFKAKHMVECH